MHKVMARLKIYFCYINDLLKPQPYSTSVQNMLCPCFFRTQNVCWSSIFTNLKLKSHHENIVTILPQMEFDETGMKNLWTCYDDNPFIIHNSIRHFELTKRHLTNYIALVISEHFPSAGIHLKTDLANWIHSCPAGPKLGATHFGAVLIWPF